MCGKYLMGIKRVSGGYKEGVLSTEKQSLESVKIQVRTGQVKTGHVRKGDKGRIGKDCQIRSGHVQPQLVETG